MLSFIIKKKHLDGLFEQTYKQKNKNQKYHNNDFLLRPINKLNDQLPEKLKPQKKLEKIF